MQELSENQIRKVEKYIKNRINDTKAISPEEHEKMNKLLNVLVLEARSRKCYWSWKKSKDLYADVAATKVFSTETGYHPDLDSDTIAFREKVLNDSRYRGLLTITPEKWIANKLKANGERMMRSIVKYNDFVSCMLSRDPKFFKGKYARERNEYWQAKNAVIEHADSWTTRSGTRWHQTRDEKEEHLEDFRAGSPMDWKAPAAQAYLRAIQTIVAGESALKERDIDTAKYHELYSVYHDDSFFKNVYLNQMQFQKRKKEILEQFEIQDDIAEEIAEKRALEEADNKQYDPLYQEKQAAYFELEHTEYLQTEQKVVGPLKFLIGFQCALYWKLTNAFRSYSRNGLSLIRSKNGHNCIPAYFVYHKIPGYKGIVLVEMSAEAIGLGKDVIDVPYSEYSDFFLECVRDAIKEGSQRWQPKMQVFDLASEGFSLAKIVEATGFEESNIIKHLREIFNIVDIVWEDMDFSDEFPAVTHVDQYLNTERFITERFDYREEYKNT